MPDDVEIGENAGLTLLNTSTLPNRWKIGGNARLSGIPVSTLPNGWQIGADVDMPSGFMQTPSDWSVSGNVNGLEQADPMKLKPLETPARTSNVIQRY